MFPRLFIKSFSKAAAHVSKISKGSLVTGTTLGSLGYLTANQESHLQGIDEKEPNHFTKLQALRSDRRKLPLDNSNPEKRAYEHIIEEAHQIKKALEETHFVFLHAQSSELTPVTDFINALMKEEGIPKSKFFKHMRKPGLLSEDAIESRIQLAQSGVDHDNYVREIIVSTDAFLNSKTAGESAQSMLRANYSVYPKKYHLRDLINNLLTQETKYLFETKTGKDVGEEVEKLGFIHKQAACGNLFVICIPKDLIKKADDPESILYRSHPLGVKCECHPGKSDIDILQSLQDNRLDNSNKCTLQIRGIVPQYRINIASLKPEDGVYILMLTPFGKEQRQTMKQEVQKLASLCATNVSTPSQESETPEVSSTFKRK